MQKTSIFVLSAACVLGGFLVYTILNWTRLDVLRYEVSQLVFQHVRLIKQGVICVFDLLYMSIIDV